jgi:hypothetical protein
VNLVQPLWHLVKPFKYEFEDLKTTFEFTGQLNILCMFKDPWCNLFNISELGQHMVIHLYLSLGGMCGYYLNQIPPT